MDRREVPWTPPIFRRPSPAEDSAEPHPAPAEEESEVEESAPSDTVAASPEEEVVAEAEKVLLDDFNKLSAERDDYLDQLRRTRADFDNYRKRMIRQQQEQRERAAEGLVEKLLPVLDTFEAAVNHGQGFEQVQASLVSLLEKEGLERIDPVGKPFDPSEADAVAHEEGDGTQVVAEVLRPGYRWKGRVVRPAMVRVRG
jgi:molecular chaperone GrpE